MGSASQDKVQIHDMEPSSQIALVLIHGGASSSRMYSKMEPILRNAYGYEHIYVPDLPGHGQNRADKPFTFEKSTAAIYSLTQSIRATNSKLFIVIVGISLGGQAVLNLIVKYPSAVDSAIVSGASIHPPDELASWTMPRLPTDDPEWMKIIMEDAGHLSPDEAQQLQKHSFDFTFDPDPSMKISAPILVLRGDEDTNMACRDWIELAQKAGMYSTSPHTTGKIIEGAWHNHPIDIPEEFAKIVNWWSTLSYGYRSS